MKARLMFVVMISLIISTSIPEILKDNESPYKYQFILLFFWLLPTFLVLVIISHAYFKVRHCKNSEFGISNQ